MLFRVYSVYDEAAEAYGVPFFMVNDKTAERAFFQLVNDPQSTVFRSPQDFSLYFIGTFHDHNAQLVPDTPVLIGRAPSYVHRLDATSPQEESSHVS